MSPAAETPDSPLDTETCINISSIRNVIVITFVFGSGQVTDDLVPKIQQQLQDGYLHLQLVDKNVVPVGATVQ